MNTQGYKRKLAAIFSADVVGYSRLMGDDEAETVKTLTAYREIICTYIKQHRGRVVDSPGDNLLAEFASVVDAAQCGVAIQKEIKARNLELRDERRMQFRIGINLGDVIEEGERLYGDGVNIAARLESLADPGGICISKTAFDHIESKLPLGYEFIGEQTVKNISRPIQAYRVIMDPRIVPDSRAKGIFQKKSTKRNFYIAAGLVVLAIIFFSTGIFSRCGGPQTEKSMDLRPSIVILPFKNMSGDPTQEAFSDGITEELIHSLAGIEELRVVSQTTSFSYKNKNLPISTIAQDLSVGHVLEGSVRKDGTKLRVTVQLISVADDAHLLSETYDREMKDIFNIQDEISNAVVANLKVKLLDTEKRKEEPSIITQGRRTGLNVTVEDDEIISGGLLLAGMNIEMAGSVKGGLMAYGGHIVISGNNQDAVSFWGGDVTLSGYFQDKVKGSAGNLIISGIFEKDLEVDAKRITITPNAVIKGELLYSGVLDRKEGSRIEGEVIETKKLPPTVAFSPDEPKEKSLASTLLLKAYAALAFLIFGLFMKFFLPKQSERIIALISSTSVFRSFMKGLLFYFLTFFVVMFSFVTVIGIPFGFFFMSLFLILSTVSVVCGILLVGRKLLSYGSPSLSKHFFISFLSGFIVIESLSLIPVAGWFVKPLLLTTCAGGVWQVTWNALKTEREEAAQEKAEEKSDADGSLSLDHPDSPIG